MGPRPPRKRAYRRRRGETARKAASGANKLRGRLTDEQLLDGCRATPTDIEALDAIIAGGPSARNAGARVKAVELKWGYGHGRPSQAIEHSGKLTLEQLILGSMQDEGERK